MDEAHEETEKLLAELQDRVKAEYRKAFQDIQKKLIDYQNAFREKNIKKLQDLQSGEISQKEYEHWYKGQVLVGQRWIDLRDQIAEDMTHSNQIANSIISGYLPSVYANNHNYGTYQVERDSMLNTAYTLYSRETVERLIRENPQLLPEPRVDIPVDQRYNEQILTSVIIQAILQGENIYKIAERLTPEMAAKATMEYFGVTTAEELERKLNIAAMRNARTMFTCAQNSGRIDAYKRCGRMGIVVYKTWLATLDGSVRDSHARLDGEERKVDEEFSNGLRYPGDFMGEPTEVWNCRCSLISQIKSTPKIDVTDLGNRHSGLSRDYEGGEDMTYQDWKDLHSENPETRRKAKEKYTESEKSKQRKENRSVK